MKTAPETGNPKFSIIVPAYNRASIITNTLNSLLHQTYPDFEILVIDDGSTDNTEDVVLSIKDSKLKYYKIANKERGGARNFGTQQARGQYLNFFDSDDIAYPHHLNEANKIIEKNNAPEMLCLGYDFVTPGNKIIRRINQYDNLNERLFTEGNILSCNPVFLRRDIALNFPFIEDRKLSGSEDAVLWMQLSARFNWQSSPEVTSALINHDDRSVVNINKEKLIERLQLFVHYVVTDIEIKKNYNPLLRHVEKEAWSYAALHLALTGMYKKDAFIYWLKSVKVLPSFIFSKRSIAILKHLFF